MGYLLHHLLTEGAMRAPGRPAVADEGLVLSYAELDKLSNQAARALLARGIRPGDRVGILARKSAASVVAAYGVLKAGACYVPLDPKSPAPRLATIIADSGIAVVFADEATGELAAGLGAAVVPWDAVRAERDDNLPAARAIETDLAYILYTSGSTGTPKGVMISHRASLTFVEWAADCAGLRAEDRVGSPAPLHFDLSVFDIFAACRAAACMVVVPEMTAMFPARLAEWMQREQITVWYSVPSVLTMLASYGNLKNADLSGMRAVIFAGEVFPAKHLSALMAVLPGPRYLNWYGPTETNVCTWYEVPPGGELSKPVPIGKPCANTDAFVVGGELYVRGPGLMRGYWGQREKTGQVLVRNPFQDAYEETAYRTGDLVTLDADGNYVFLGRRDGMVKTRGYRVELGEVETALYGHPAIREAVVLPVPDELLGNRLRAVIGTAGADGLTREEVLDHCRRRLPAYMVPDVVEFCDALPRTSNGKVDRIALGTERREAAAQVGGH
jgi:amino acid adenylation domain-containing protein